MDIILYKDKVYGRNLYYPGNGNADILCKLMKKKAMGIADVNICKDFPLWNVVILVEKDDENAQGT